MKFMLLSVARLIVSNHYPGYVIPKSKRKEDKEEKEVEEEIRRNVRRE